MQIQFKYMMKNLAKISSILGLLLTGIPAFLVFAQQIDLDTNKWLMLIGTIVWFVSAPFAYSK